MVVRPGEYPDEKEILRQLKDMPDEDLPEPPGFDKLETVFQDTNREEYERLLKEGEREDRGETEPDRGTEGMDELELLRQIHDELVGLPDKIRSALGVEE